MVSRKNVYLICSLVAFLYPHPWWLLKSQNAIENQYAKLTIILKLMTHIMEHSNVWGKIKSLPTYCSSVFTHLLKECKGEAKWASLRKEIQSCGATTEKAFSLCASLRKHLENSLSWFCNGSMPFLRASTPRVPILFLKRALLHYSAITHPPPPPSRIWNFYIYKKK